MINSILVSLLIKQVSFSFKRNEVLNVMAFLSYHNDEINIKLKQYYLALQNQRSS